MHQLPQLIDAELVERIAETRAQTVADEVIPAAEMGGGTAALLRLRPIMMTALVAALGLLPAALSSGVGADTQKPFALVIVGGLGSLHGTVFGAIFVALLPPVIAILRDSIPNGMADFAAATGLAPIGSLGAAIGAFLAKPGVEAGIFGLILVLVILLEPLGMYGRWVKIRIFFSTFPMYKASTFKRQKTYMRSERLR